MENQHRKISGYRELCADEIELINMIKDHGSCCGELVDASERIDGVDKRALSIARTQLQTGYMWLVRAIAKPGGF